MPWFPGQVSHKSTGIWATSVLSKPWYFHVWSEPRCIPPSPHSGGGEIRAPSFRGGRECLGRTDTCAWERPPVQKEWPSSACLFLPDSPSTPVAAHSLSHPTARIECLLHARSVHAACQGYRVEQVPPLRVPGHPAVVSHERHGGLGTSVHSVSTMCWCTHFPGCGGKRSCPGTKIIKCILIIYIKG